MAAGTTVTILPCGAMTADLTWLLLAPGRSIRSRQQKQLPAEWVDVPTHCVLVDTPDGRLLWDTSCPRNWEEHWAPTGLQDFFPYDKVSEDEYLDSRLKQLGLAPRDLDYVAFSHLHFDHAGNAQLFKDSGARLVCSEGRRTGRSVSTAPSTARTSRRTTRGWTSRRSPATRSSCPGSASSRHRATRPAACRCGSTCPRPAR
jgi:glyoxylase-like metal-dependent hydrolase (beta-lactamase superfamily II)